MLSDDPKLMVGKAPPRDYWEESNESIKELCLNGKAMQSDSFVIVREAEDEAFFVTVDDDNKLLTIEVTLSPWQATQVIEFIRNLPKEPDDG